ncbi:MAG: TPM domain-containing protein [Spirochaetales bacterium]|nr:TPM domain-containing protein [Spirochaetales bacterium]
MAVVLSESTARRAARTSWRLRALAAAALVLFLPVAVLGAIEVPRLQGRVNDYAGMISASAKAQLEERMRSLEESDSTQLVVLTIPSLDGEDLEGFALRVAETWAIGQEEYDNGVLLLVSQEERKVRIEVGYGLEGRLTDLQAGRIIDYEIVPRFRAGDFDEGFLRGTDAIVAAVRGEYEGQGPARAEEQGGSRGVGVVPFFILAIILSAIGSRKRIVSAVAGAILLPLVALIALPFSWLLLLLMLPGGFVAGLLLPMLFPFVGGRPGGRHYGGFGGSGFSGGGFSGGGGGFGGGGASGGW